MVQPMKGIRVLDVCDHTFVPAASAVLADWGADVIKIEHAQRGDAARGLGSSGAVDLTGKVHAILEHANRGKRSLGLDLQTEEGLSVLHRLIAISDVFLINKPPNVRERLHITEEEVRRHNESIVYAAGTAWGPKGPEGNRGGYDMTSFWVRSGAAMGTWYTDDERMPSQPGPAFGDSIGAMTIAGGIATALFHRERTGEALCHRLAVANDEGVDVNSLDAVFSRRFGHAQQCGGQRIPIHRRFSPHRAQQNRNPQVVDHVLAVGLTYRKQSEHRFPDCLGQHAAQAEHERGAELLGNRDAGDELPMSGHHLRHQHGHLAVVGCGRGQQVFCREPHRIVSVEAQSHQPPLALVGQRRAAQFHGHRATDL